MAQQIRFGSHPGEGPGAFAWLLLIILSFAAGVVAMDFAQENRERGRICVPVDVEPGAEEKP